MINKEKALESMIKIASGTNFGIDIDNVIEFASTLESQSIQLAQPSIEELKQEIINELQCEYDEEDNMFYVEGEWEIFVDYGTFECELDLKLPLLNKIVTYFTRLEDL